MNKKREPWTPTRGVRNNNPGNIRINPNTVWVGQVPKEKRTDSQFVQFESMELGLRAMFVTIDNYGSLHNVRTIEGIIRRWAPSSDGNNAEAYIKAVCSIPELSPNFKIYRGVTVAEFKLLVRAMCWVESQYVPTDKMLEDAYRMAFCQTSACLLVRE